MAGYDVDESVTCPDGHGAESLIRWDGSRADYACMDCQVFFDIDEDGDSA